MVGFYHNTGDTESFPLQKTRRPFQDAKVTQQSTSTGQHWVFIGGDMIKACIPIVYHHHSASVIVIKTTDYVVQQVPCGVVQGIDLSWNYRSWINLL